MYRRLGLAAGDLVSFAFLCPSVGAHHPAVEQHPSHVSVITQALFEGAYSRYNHDGIRASVWSWSAGGDYVFHPHASAGLRLGVHTADPDTGGSRTGIGDLDLNLKVRLLPAKNDAGPNLVGGVGIELPTGDDGKGLGSGHVEFSPFIAFMRPVGRASVHGGAAVIISASDKSHEHGAEEKVNFVNPHEDREIRAHLGSVWSFERGLYLNAVLATSLPVSGSHKGDAFLDAKPELGVFLPQGWAVALVGQLPLTNERRFDHQVGLQVRKRFGR